MRAFVIVVVQLVLSLFITVSLMPLVLVTTPAAQVSPRFGIGIMAAMMVVSFTLIALAWPRRLR